MARQSIAARVLSKGALAALILGSSFALAGEATARFGVSVNLQAETPPEFGACKANEVLHSKGVTATVTCTPVPIPKQPGADGRVVSSVLFHISRGTWLGTADETMGLGTVTSWRVIRLANRDYLEMMVGW